MLTQYKNIDQIQNAEKSISATRIDTSNSNFLSYDANSRIFQVPEIVRQQDDIRIELHAYSNDSWITGNHRIELQNKIPSFTDTRTKKQIKLPSQPISIDLYKEFESLKLTAGTFKIAVNFLKNLIGSYEEQYLRIDEISPDRTEIRLRAIDESNPIFLQQITKYISTVQHTTGQYLNTYLLNFSRNQTAFIVNSVVMGEYIYVKLYEPLIDTIDVNFKCWVVQELKPAYIDKVSITPLLVPDSYKKLANPNWQANYSYNTSTETGLKNWNDLLGSSVQTSQQIVDSYFSGSLSGVKLNIDYSDFNNFIFYSTATERLENFKYKLELIEYYNSQSIVVAQLSGSVATTNAADYETSRTALISGFDSFEQYLYYQSSSILTTYEIPNESAIVPTITGSYITPVPKSNSTVPYTLVSTTSTQFKTWYQNLYETASLFDSLNSNALINAIPEYIRYDQNNDQITTFVNMLGHHYDILYTYITHMTRINKREENPKLGMPNELLYSVAKQFGWNLTDGNQYQDLWQYVLGTNETGTPLTGSNTVGDPSVPGRDMTYAVWRRIVNNLPLLLKSKGTKRSIQALLACYGVPQSMITIKEYGGPRIDRAPVYEKLNFDYALDLINTTAGTVNINYKVQPTELELRFRTDDVIANPTISSSMELFNIDNNSVYVTIDFVSGTKGTISINGGTPSDPIEMFDGGWLTVLVSENAGDLYVIVKRSKYGKIVAETSATSSGTTFPAALPALLTLGDSVNASRLQGQIQELRLWSGSNTIVPYFDNHVTAPAAYNSLDPYNELVFRLPLTQKVNHTLTSSLQGVQPQSASFDATFTGWTLDTPYDSIEETYYYDAPSLGAGTYDDNKIRLESNQLIGNLDVKTRAERSQYDTAPIDSKKLGVYFSPQTMIDEDIIAQYGFITLDDYIGDPGELDSKSYPELIWKAQEYWKKYANKNDINSYIKIFTLFDLSFFKQLEQLLPARADKVMGVLIQPNLLERSKDKILPAIQKFETSYLTEISNVQPTGSADYLYYLGNIQDKILEITGIDDDQWQMYLTASTEDKYDGTLYSHEYLIRSASTWITASTPEWESEAVLPTFISSVKSEYRFVSGTVYFVTESIYGSIYGSSSYGTGSYSSIYYNLSGSYAEVQDFTPRGIDNQRYSGAKLTSPAFNINSTQTVDGGPVVEWRTTNPNQLIYQTNGDQGSFVLV